MTTGASAPAEEEIARRISAFITGELVRDSAVTIGPDDNLLTGDYIDSVGIMRLIGHLESTFRVTIPPTDLVPDHFRTVRVMAAYLSRLGASAPS